MTNNKRATKTDNIVENAETAIVEETAVVVEDASATDMDKNVEEDVQPKPKAKKVVKIEEVEELLQDFDIIEVKSIVPNVSYKDSHTEDIYRWESAGHIEEMTFDEVKRMWKSHKNYFRNMWLRPMDERVIKKFGLENNYNKHDFLMDAKNYTRNNVDDILDGISAAPNGMKIAIINKIKSMVYSGQLSDINVIKKIDARLGLDLISMV